MAERLVIRLHAGDATDPECFRVAGDPGPRAQVASIAPSAGAPGGPRAVLIVPAEDVLLRVLPMPPGRARDVQRALHFAVEESVVGGVETLRVRHHARDRDGNVRAAMVADAALARWRARLAVMATGAVDAVPDALCLPPAEGGGWSLLVEGERLLVRCGPWDGFAGERDVALRVLRRRLAGDGAPATLDCWYAPGDAAVARAVMNALADRAACSARAIDASASALLARGADPSAALDFGLGGAAAAAARGLRAYRPAAAVLALALTGHVGLSAWEAVHFERARHAAAEETERLFRATFPDVKRVVNVRAQAAQRLAAAHDAGVAADPFLELMTRTGVELSQAQARPLALSYGAGTLQLRVEARDLSALERLRAALAGQALAAEVIGVENANGRAVGTMKISGDAP